MTTTISAATISAAMVTAAPAMCAADRRANVTADAPTPPAAGPVHPRLEGPPV